MEQPAFRESAADALRAKIRKGNLDNHKMALRALTLSLVSSGRAYISTRNELEQLPRRKHEETNRIRKMWRRTKTKKRMARELIVQQLERKCELVAQENTLLESIDRTRAYLQQQLESTASHPEEAFQELAERFGAKLIYLEARGAEALAELGKQEELAMQAGAISALKEKIAAIQHALRERLEWLPQLSQLIASRNAQYQTLLSPP